MNKRLVIGGLAATLATTLTGTLAATTLSTSASAEGNHDPQGRPAAAGRTTPSVVKCDGEKVVNLRSRIVNSPFTFVETGVNDQDQDVPGATLAAKGPRKGTDTVLVTFSAESQITGGDANDWLGLEVHLDGTPINPFTASGDVLAFTGEPSWNSNSMQFCTKLKPGNHKFQVTANLHDSSGAHSLAGWLDDYTVSFVRFD